MAWRGIGKMVTVGKIIELKKKMDWVAPGSIGVGPWS
jgi:hypothetical protein